MGKRTTKCQTCDVEFEADTRDLNRGRAKYCSLSCAAKVSKQLQYERVCKHCGSHFHSSSKHSLYCSDSCKQKNYRAQAKDSGNMKQLYKLFKDTPCEICGWDETSRDLHHIVEVSNGGKSIPDNLISVCPNHHRMIHKNLISKDTLLKCVEDRTISSPSSEGTDAKSGN